MISIIKIYTYILVLVTAVNTSAKSTLPAKAAGQKATYYYLEVPPSTKKKIVIQSIKCNPNYNELSIQRFDSESKVVNNKVITVNIYANSSSCKHSPLSGMWSKEISIPKRDLWTHIRITSLSDNIIIF